MIQNNNKCQKYKKEHNIPEIKRFNSKQNNIGLRKNRMKSKLTKNF